MEIKTPTILIHTISLILIIKSLFGSTGKLGKTMPYRALSWKRVLQQSQKRNHKVDAPSPKGRISLLTVSAERHDKQKVDGVLGKVDGPVSVGIVYGKVNGPVAALRCQTTGHTAEK